MKPSWYYLRQAAMMMPADQMANPLEHTSLSQTELLMREAVQNSVDERREDSDEPIKFCVRRLSLRGDEKRSLVEHLRLEEMDQRSERFRAGHGWFKTEETCLPSLADPDAALSVLVLSDHNTNGLGGCWNRLEGADSRFHNLVLSIYVSRKFEELAGRLGSYGMGKMAYAVTSNIRTVAYYSTFRKTDASKGASSRFMATAFLPPHDSNDGTQYTGHAFFGIGSGADDYPARPLENINAHEFAAAIGLEERSENDTGLTVALLDCPISVQDCLEACEKYWWPRILGRDPLSHVELEFFDEDRRLPGPRPRDRRDLNPFIDCFSNLKGNLTPEGYDNRPIRNQNFGVVGQLCLKALPDDEPKKISIPSTVALIRDGLVIQYNPNYAQEGDPPVIGVFEAHGEDPKRAFTLSEPEAHDEWNSNSSRLARSLGQEYVAMVRRTHDRIKERFRDFQTRQKKLPPKSTTEGLNFLDELLGPFFKRRKTGTRTPPPPRRSAFSVSKRGWRDYDSAPAQDNLDFSISLSKDLNVESVACRIKVILKVLQDVNGHPKDVIPSEIFSEDGHVVPSDDGGGFVVGLEGKPIKFHARAPVHKSWRTKWTISVSKFDDNESEGREA